MGFAEKNREALEHFYRFPPEPLARAERRAAIGFFY